MSDPPVLRIVVGGEPSDEETAALTAVLTLVATAAAAAGGDEPAVRSRWRGSAQPASAWARVGWLAAARRSALRQQR